MYSKRLEISHSTYILCPKKLWQKSPLRVLILASGKISGCNKVAGNTNIQKYSHEKKEGSSLNGDFLALLLWQWKYQLELEI